MRERLIELFKQADEKAGEYICENDHMDFIPTKDELAGVYADHLLANGVIVPPCKVGDTVYYISCFDGYEKICGKKVKRIWFDNEGLVFTVRGMYMDFNIPENELYITREEAEEALEKMRGGVE